MTRRNQHYPPELRERAVRTVFEVTPNYDSQWAAINAVAQKLGVGTANARPWGDTPRPSGAAIHVLRRDRLGGLLHEYRYRGTQIATPFNIDLVDPAAARFRRTGHDDVEFVGQVSELLT